MTVTDADYFPLPGSCGLCGDPVTAAGHILSHGFALCPGCDQEVQARRVAWINNELLAGVRP